MGLSRHEANARGTALTLWHWFKAERFTVADICRKNCPWNPMPMRDDMTRWNRLLRDMREWYSLVEDAPGPRGGVGYRLSANGIRYAERKRASS